MPGPVQGPKKSPVSKSSDITSHPTFNEPHPSVILKDLVFLRDSLKHEITDPAHAHDCNANDSNSEDALFPGWKGQRTMKANHTSALGCFVAEGAAAEAVVVVRLNEEASLKAFGIIFL